MHKSEPSGGDGANLEGVGLQHRTDPRGLASMSFPWADSSGLHPTCPGSSPRCVRGVQEVVTQESSARNLSLARARAATRVATRGPRSDSATKALAGIARRGPFVVCSMSSHATGPKQSLTRARECAKVGRGNDRGRRAGRDGVSLLLGSGELCGWRTGENRTRAGNMHDVLDAVKCTMPLSGLPSRGPLPSPKLPEGAGHAASSRM